MKYVVLDIETTGFSVEKQEITEISILRCEDLVQCTWDVLIKHPERASPEALEVTHKTIGELMSRGRHLEDIMDEIDEFMKDISNDPDEIVCIGHYVRFDRNFLETKWKEFGKTWKANYWLDTWEMSKKYVKNVVKIKEKTPFDLKNMLKLASIKELPGAHSSTVDVQNTYKLYMHMLKRGMSNSEFIKMSPTLLESASKPTKQAKTKKKELDFAELSNIADSLKEELSQGNFEDLE